MQHDHCSQTIDKDSYGITKRGYKKLHSENPTCWADLQSREIIKSYTLHHFGKLMLYYCYTHVPTYIPFSQ